MVIEQKSFEEAKNDHITTLQDQLDKIEESIRMSATIPIKESKLIKMQDSQHSMVNGFKVSFANLSLKKSKD
jgi:hypothetical protein